MQFHSLFFGWWLLDMLASFSSSWIMTMMNFNSKHKTWESVKEVMHRVSVWERKERTSSCLVMRNELNKLRLDEHIITQYTKAVKVVYIMSHEIESSKTFFKAFFFRKKSEKLFKKFKFFAALAEHKRN